VTQKWKPIIFLALMCCHVTKLLFTVRTGCEQLEFH